MVISEETRTIKLNHRGDGHYCCDNTLWLATFHDRPGVYVCWTRRMDEMGGNPVEVDIELVNADSRKPLSTLRTQRWQYREDDQSAMLGVSGWEELGYMQEEEWRTFIAGEAREDIWQAVHARIDGEMELGSLEFTLAADRALRLRNFMQNHKEACTPSQQYTADDIPVDRYEFIIRETQRGTLFTVRCSCGESLQVRSDYETV